MCFMLCRLKYDYNDFNTVSFIIIWCYDVIYCDVNPAVQLQIKRYLYHRFEHQAECNLGGSDKSWTAMWNQLLQNTP